MPTGGLQVAPMSLTDFRIFSGRCPDPPPKPNPTSDSVANAALNTRNYLSPQQVKGRVVENDQFSYETQPHHQLGGGFGLCTEEAHSEADRQVWRRFMQRSAGACPSGE